jgi:hypothetical protein
LPLLDDKFSQFDMSKLMWVQQKLQDAGRTLKSKTNDVVQYGAHRNADDVPADATEKNIKAQKEYTDSL